MGIREQVERLTELAPAPREMVAAVDGGARRTAIVIESPAPDPARRMGRLPGAGAIDADKVTAGDWVSVRRAGHAPVLVEVSAVSSRGDAVSMVGAINDRGLSMSYRPGSVAVLKSDIRAGRVRVLLLGRGGRVLGF